MSTIPDFVLEMIEQRYCLKAVYEIPFNPERRPAFTHKVETIFLLDETLSRMTTLILGETVGEALTLLGENAADVTYVLVKDDETVSTLFHS